MPIFTQGDNKCYFAHVPRTGGRYVTSLFQNNNTICEHHLIEDEVVEGIQAPNLHYPLYEKNFDVSDIPHITVVRNPFTKFQSCIRNMHVLYHDDYNLLLGDEKKFFNFVSEEIISRSVHNNWFLPQQRFLSPKMKVWKYEWGFGKNFLRWIYKKTGIVIENTAVTYNHLWCENPLFPAYHLDKKVKTNVRKFYRDDYRRFRYFL